FELSRFKNEARFIKTKFQAQATDGETVENNFDEALFETVLFSQIDFKGRTSFEKTTFKKSTFRKITFFQEEITFWESEFERVNLIDCIFPHQTNFDRCVLKNTLFKNQKEIKPMFQDVKFQDCVFKETNTFGEKVFSIELKPILTTNTFEGQFNIDHQYLHYEPEEIPRENISIWRDLFRRLKSNRLAHHNIIDASELHTQELYAREIELEEKEKQNKTSLKEKVEKWQLYFYRLTSDHHTDLAKIFNNVILLIALFGIFACATTLFTQTIEIVKPKINNIPIFALLQTKSYIFSELPKKIPIEIGLVSLAIVNFCGIYSYLELRKVVQEKLFSFKIIDILLVVCIACCLYYRLSEAFFIFFLCFAFVASYILCLQIQKFFITIFSYLVCVGVLILKPTLLLPFVGRFLESSPTTSFPAMQSLSVVYCILMFLMLFSLQKTARKNSIIPS
ncbi:pentapeptide repeat-containing protein, partial [Helicobacter pametensis]